MANNLTPEQLKALQAHYAQNSSGVSLGDITPYQSGGNYLQANQTRGTGMDQVGNNQTTGGYYGYQDGMTDPGMKYQQYGSGGDWEREGEFLDPTRVDAVTLAALAAITGGAAYGAGMFGGGAAAGGGMGNGAFLGEAPWTATAGGGTMPGGFGAAEAAAGGGYEGGLNALNGSDIMSDQFVANGGYGSGGFGGTSGTYVDNLINGEGLLSSRVMGGTGAGGASTAASTVANTAGGASNWLGPAATIAGAALGSQGRQSEQTTAKDIPEWLKPSVMGLLGQADALRNRQMAPGYLQGYDDMRSVGQGLLNQPVAGNGFNKFFSGR